MTSMRVRSTSQRSALRSAIAIVWLGGPLALAGCSSTVAFDAPFSDYLQRTALVSTTGGESQAANTAVQTATPWPRYADNTNIPANGALSAKAVKRYESGAASEGAAQTTATPGAGATSGGASTGMTTSSPAPSPGS
jgi:hypothetical protein